MKKKNKNFKTIGIIAGAVILLIVAGFFVLKIVLKNKIESSLEAGIFPGHTARTSAIDIDFFGPSIKAEKLVILPDTARDALEKMDNYRIDSCYIAKLGINGIGAIRYLLFNSLEINDLEIDSTFLLITLLDEKSSPEEIEKAAIKSIEVNNINISEAVIKVMQKGWKSPLIQVERLNLSAENLGLEQQKTKGMRIHYPSLSELLVEGLKARISKGFYKLQAGSFKLEKESDFLLQDFKLIPQYKKYVFAEKLGHQTDRIMVMLDEAEILGFDYEKLNENILQCRKIKTHDLYADFFRDKNVPRLPDFRPPMPQQLLQKGGINICVDTIDLRKNKVNYTEHVPQSPQPGFVFFDDLNILLLNVNNNPGFFKTGKWVHAYATGAVMGEGLARIKIKFPATPEPDTVFFTGELEQMQLSFFNAMLERSQFVRINEGYVDKITFDAQGNNDFAKGKLTFLYRDLNIKMMKNEGERINEERGFYSFLVNTIIRSNNPVGKKEPLVASMYFERDKEKSFLNFLWKTVLSGITTTIKPGKKNLEREKE